MLEFLQKFVFRHFSMIITSRPVVTRNVGSGISGVIRLVTDGFLSVQQTTRKRISLLHYVLVWGDPTFLSCFSLFQAFRYWGAVRSKKEREKIKAREGERWERHLSPQSPSTFHRFLYSAPLSTIWTLGTGYSCLGKGKLVLKSLVFALEHV